MNCPLMLWIRVFRSGAVATLQVGVVIINIELLEDVGSGDLARLTISVIKIIDIYTSTQLYMATALKLLLTEKLGDLI